MSAAHPACRKLLWCACAAFLITPGVARPDCSPEALIRRGELAAAEEQLAQIEEPTSYQLWLLGAVQLRLREYEAARASLERMLSIETTPRRWDEALQRLRRVHRHLTAHVQIVSQPPGAQVFLDTQRRAVGETPLELTLVPGHHRVRLLLRDHVPVDDELEASDRSTVRLSYQLVRTPPPAPLDAPPRDTPVPVSKQVKATPAASKLSAIFGVGATSSFALPSRKPIISYMQAWSTLVIPVRGPFSFLVGIGFQTAPEVGNWGFVPSLAADFQLKSWLFLDAVVYGILDFDPEQRKTRGEGTNGFVGFGPALVFVLPHNFILSASVGFEVQARTREWDIAPTLGVGMTLP